MIVDNTRPIGKWEFDQDVTDAFDDMLQRSIPQYEVMRRAVTDIAGTFLLNQSDDAGVIDLGCSRGEAIAALVDEFPQVEFGGIDASAPMAAAAKARFVDYPNVNIVAGDVRTHPLCDLLPYIPATVILSVLTLQFLPVFDRLAVLDYAHANMTSGGCLILVEKVHGRTPRNEILFRDLYHANKRRNGYSDAAIRAKATALEGVLMPLTAAENEALLKDAEFVGVECFWRWMNFAGWIAVKP
jgi:tRNA (cmo5U34)-methyltransferase